MNVLSAIKTAWNATRFFVVKHAPTILTVGGTAATVAGTVFACKSTMKLKDLMNERDADKAAVEENNANGVYTDQEYKKELLRCKMTTAKELVKLYAAPAIMTVAGVTGIFSGYGIINKRNAALGAAVVGLERTLEGYRGRVREKLGDEEEAKLMFPTHDIEVTHEVPDEETGEIVTDKHVVRQLDDISISPYAFVWNESTSNLPSGDAHSDYGWMIKEQNNWNDVRRNRYPRPVFLNEVLVSLGLDPVQYGQLAGWLNRDIDFGIGNNRFFNEGFINGRDDEVLLDFNCEGNVMGALPKKTEADPSFRKHEE